VLTRTGVQPEGTGKNAPDPTLRTRFVVDIVTGSSAGGINGIYLAKALANDQDIDQLKKLWVELGDVSILLNDEESYKKLEPALTDAADGPWSVLHSRRIYLELLKALRGMDAKAKACDPGCSPLVDELDLFVTTTDMPGRVLQLRLADKLVSEYRHRNVFQFRYRSERASGIGLNDFGPRYNPFLAFAARATSAHQAAFSPVRLDDITDIVNVKEYRDEDKNNADDEYNADNEALRAFYREYLLQRAGADKGGAGASSDPAKLAADFRGVWFVDGGTLDNKPFSFVAEQLPLRHADMFVDRKLLYVEPSPEHLKRTQELKDRPRIKKNALAALSSLPRYETIVEDLTRLLERNRLVQRVNRITADFEDDIRLRHQGLWPRHRQRDDMRPRKVGGLIDEKGAAWGAYQRLRIGQVTDDLTLLVARAAGFDEESEEFAAIRELVRQWRRANYDDHGKGRRKAGDDGQGGREPKTEIEFLIDYDLQWTMRRVRFVIQKIDELYLLNARARKLARLTRQRTLGIMLKWPRAAQEKEFRRMLRSKRDEFNQSLSRLRAARRRYWAYRTDRMPAPNGGPGDVPLNPFCDEVDALGVSGEMLQDFIERPTEKEREKMLKAHLDDPTHRDAFDRLVQTVKESFNQQIEDSRKVCRAALSADKFEKLNEEANGRRARPAPKEKKQLDLDESLSYILLYYYNYFEDFDQVSYPAFYSTDVGEEADIIDVFRVSPEDAREIIKEGEDEAKVGEKLEYVQKLAGTTLGNFGAFFERKFRVNDITWGRLDGAERLIAALLPAPHDALRQKMTKQAHRAILVEEELAKDEAAAKNDALKKLVWDALDAWDDPAERERLLSQAAAQMLKAAPMLPAGSSLSSFHEYLGKLLRKDEPRDLFKEQFIKEYNKSRQFTRATTIESAKRANRVLVSMAHASLQARGVGGWTQKLAMLFGRVLRTFAEAAIDPEGSARYRQRTILFFCYVLSLLILVGVSRPAFMLISAEWPRPGLGRLVGFFVTLLLAAIPLGLTVGYTLAWRWLNRLLGAHLPPRD
jgi:patatin-related protein